MGSASSSATQSITALCVELDGFHLLSLKVGVPGYRLMPLRSGALRRTLGEVRSGLPLVGLESSGCLLQGHLDGR